MKKFTFLLIAAFMAVASWAGTKTVTFDFNAMDVPTSGTGVTAGDITEALDLTEGPITLTVSTSTTNTPNRFWDVTNVGPQLRVYGGTLTFATAEGNAITKIVFNHNGKWGANTVGDVAIPNDADNKVATWTGEAQEVVVTVAANSQINNIEVTYTFPDPQTKSYTFSFDDGDMFPWTTIDADGDGYDWTIGSEQLAFYGEEGLAVYSQSYANGVGPLTPDNYLVSPKINLDGSITFYACAQDGAWPAEHFGVFVSTKGNTDAKDFEKIQEWTMTASRVNAPAKAPNKTPGNWYEFTVDLSSYAGAEGYVAIRHFDCTDLFYLVVDEITLETSKVSLPDFIVTPTDDSIVKSLGDFQIAFYNYDVTAEGVTATLKNITTGTSQNAAEITAEDNVLYISFEPTKEAGEYELTINGVKDADGKDVELVFGYLIIQKPDVVELPEGAEVETWYFSATASESSVDEVPVSVAFVDNDIYIQGINEYYIPEAWVKGTLNQDGTATFAAGQYFGAFEYGGDEYDMYFVGTADGQTVSDVTFDVDLENGILTTDDYIVVNAYPDEVGYYEYYYDVEIVRTLPELPDPVVAPEDLETYTAYLSCNSYNGKIRGREVQVGYKGTDAYIQGLCEYIPEAWVKGTIDLASQTVTFPTGQFYGTFVDDYYEESYNFFFVGYDYDADEIADVVFDLDVENQTLTTDQWIILNGKQNKISYYDYYYDVVISKEMPEMPQVVEAPEDLVTDPYQFKGFDTYFEEEETREIQAGFYGEGQVYIQGLSYYVPEAWVVGTLEGTTLTIPETYLGIYEGWFGDSEIFFSGATFTYDAEAGTFTSEDGFVTYETPDDEYWMDEYAPVVLTKLADFAATPADPEITALNTDPTATYQSVRFNIPLESTEGEPLMGAKMSYQLFIEKGGVQQPLTLVAELYENLDEDMTEIPYGFTEGWDIYAGAVYFNQGLAEINSWTKVGIQSIYRGGGEVNKSNIVWMENEYFDPTTGINDINANNTAVYYDMQGRVADASAKGLLIKQTRNADGTVKTQKVVRK